MERVMKMLLKAAVAMLAGSTQIAAAQPMRWQTYNVPETGTSVDIPSSIFTENVGRPPQGDGQRFRSADGRADLTIQAATIGPSVSPAAFLASQHPPENIQYKRITPRFFAVSGYKGDKVWYDRCNFSNGSVHCVLINYPAQEERAWDGIVTRISLSLSGK
jgi:hypothetical protein